MAQCFECDKCETKIVSAHYQVTIRRLPDNKPAVHDLCMRCLLELLLWSKGKFESRGEIMPTQTPICPVCLCHMEPQSCKLVCKNCGFKYDCSDGNVPLPEQNNDGEFQCGT